MTMPTTIPKPRRGEVLCLRTCAADMTSRNGFAWPKRGMAEAPDWKPTKQCGNGLHGLIRGTGDYTLVSADPAAFGMVVAVREDELVSIGLDKVKFPRCRVVYVGTLREAATVISARYPGVAVHYATATAGHSGTATAGYRGTATAGDSGTATAGDSGTATAGDWGTATAGYRGKVRGGMGCRLLVGDAMGIVGKDGIEADTWYTHRDGALVKAEDRP